MGGVVMLPVVMLSVVAPMLVVGMLVPVVVGPILVRPMLVVSKLVMLVVAARGVVAGVHGVVPAGRPRGMLPGRVVDGRGSPRGPGDRRVGRGRWPGPLGCRADLGFMDKLCKH
ncbi:hypothetical protein [Streptomyces sp. NHF165]|uniref:hypothetical protein n=1 Tax=Streptomyces sp. NHF165 TaxID=2175864 RepID=UPI00135AF962|nr:hypothetical protein [Streptomyces sp. NHF165]